MPCAWFIFMATTTWYLTSLNSIGHDESACWAKAIYYHYYSTDFLHYLITPNFIVTHDIVSCIGPNLLCQHNFEHNRLLKASSIMPARLAHEWKLQQNDQCNLIINQLVDMLITTFYIYNSLYKTFVVAVIIMPTW